MLITCQITSEVKMNTPIWETFGPWLQAERNRAKVSQEEVARRVGINVVQLSRIENGHSGSKRETVMAIVEAVNDLSKSRYQIDLDEAMKRAGYASPSKDEIFNVMDKARISFLDNSFTPDEKERLLDMMRTLVAGAIAAKGNKEENQ